MIAPLSRFPKARKRIRRMELRLRDWLLRRNPPDEEGIILLPVPRETIKRPETITVTASKVMDERTRDFLGEDLIRQALIDKLKEELWLYSDFEESWEESIKKYIYTVKIEIVKEKKTWQN